MANPYIVNYVDENGDKATSHHWVAEATTAPGDMDALQTAAKAILSVEISSHAVRWDEEILGLDATENPYDGEDKVVFQCLDADGHYQRVIVPAPDGGPGSGDNGIFQADDETVDITNPLVSAFITELLAYLITRGGKLLVDCIKGWRSRKSHKK